MTLYARIGILIVVVAASIGLAIDTAGTRLMHQTLKSELKDTGILLARTVADVYAEQIRRGEYDHVTTAVRGLVNENPQLDYVFFVDQGGDVVLHSFDSVIPVELSSLARAQTITADTRTKGDTTTVHVSHGLDQLPIARIHIGVNENQIKNQITDFKYGMMKTTAVVTLMAVTLGIFFGRRMTRPLSYLAELMQAYGRGVKVQTEEASFRQAGREVAELGLTFQQMLNERRRAERELRKREDELREAQALTHLGSWEWDPATDLMQWSSELHTIFGVSDDEYDGSIGAFLDVIHLEDRDKVERLLDRMRETHEPTYFFFRIVRPDGSERFINGYGRVELDKRGNPLRMYGTCQDVTEIQQAKATLREKETQLKSIVEHAPVIMWLIDCNGVFQLSEGQGLRALGFTPGALVGQSAYDFFGDLPSGQDDLSRALNGEVFTATTKLDEHNFECHYSPLYSAEHKLLASICVAIDVTERLNAQALTDRLGRILDSSANEIYVFDAEDLHFIQANKGARENLGYTIEELRTLTPVDIKPEFTQPIFEKTIEPLRTREKECVAFEAIHQRKDGSTYPVEVNLQLSRSENPPLFHAIILDTSTRKHAEEQLKKINIELEKHQIHLEKLVAERTARIAEQATIIDQIHDSVVSTDLDGHVTSWNKGAERLFGYLADEAYGQHISFIYRPEDHVLLQKQILESLREKGEYETEVGMIRKDGDTFYAHLSLSMLYDEKREPRGMVCYSIDITARKNAQALLKKRTEELVTANNELEGFAYSVSHDLRAPLRAIDGFSKALLEDYGDKLNDEGRLFLERVVAGADTMSQLIDDLLQLSRVARGELRRERIDVTSVAQSIATRLSDCSSSRNFDLTIAPGLVANADAKLFKTLMENLLTNAWKFTAKQPIAHIEVGSMDVHGERAYFVKDNGLGFDMSYASTMFGAFQRFHSVQEFEGTGIGLATVRRITHRHGGRVWAQSEPGKGATFFFTLPAELPELNEELCLVRGSAEKVVH